MFGYFKIMLVVIGAAFAFSQAAQAEKVCVDYNGDGVPEVCTGE